MPVAAARSRAPAMAAAAARRTQSMLPTRNAWIDSSDTALDGPRAGDQMDRAVFLDRQRRPDSVAQRGAATFAERHCVTGRGTLSAEKRRPIVVEIAKVCAGIHRHCLHVAQSRLGEELCQRSWLTDRKPASFVQVASRG